MPGVLGDLTSIRDLPVLKQGTQVPAEFLGITADGRLWRIAYEDVMQMIAQEVDERNNTESPSM